MAHSNCYSEGPDAIALGTATYSISLTHLTGWDDNGLTGDLDVWGDLQITGDGDLYTFIAGAFMGHPLSDRIFEVQTPGSTLELHDLQVRNGNLQEPPDGAGTGYISQQAGGGLIRSEGGLILESVIAYNGQAVNTWGDEGGACIYISPSGSGFINNSQIDTCTLVESDGGAIHAEGDLTIQNSLINIGTTTKSGGGIAASANFSMHGSDVGSCDANSQGGGLYLNTGASHTVEITNSSFTENSQSGCSMNASHTACAAGPIYPDYWYFGGAAVSADGATIATFENVTFGYNISLARAGSVYTRSGTPSLSFIHLTQGQSAATYGPPGVMCNAGTCEFSESIVTDDGCGPGTTVLSGSSNLAESSPSCVAAGFSSGSAYLKSSTTNTGTNNSHWYIIQTPASSDAVDGSSVCPVDDQSGNVRSTASCELGSYEVP